MHDFAPNAWCKHVAALGYELINRCEVDAFYPFKLRGFDLLSAVPMRPRKRARDQEVICLLSDEDEENDGASPGRAIEL